MPLYEYECDQCGYRFEVIQKFSDSAIETCQKCGGTVKKLLSSPAIQFKGSGWYITDYARAGKSEATKDTPEKGGTAAGEAKTESKSQSKGETKTEAKSEAKSEKPATSTPSQS